MPIEGSDGAGSMSPSSASSSSGPCSAGHQYELAASRRLAAKQAPIYDTIRSRLPTLKQLEEEFPDYKQPVWQPRRPHELEASRPVVIVNYGYATVVGRRHQKQQPPPQQQQQQQQQLATIKHAMVEQDEPFSDGPKFQPLEEECNSIFVHAPSLRAQEEAAKRWKPNQMYANLAQLEGRGGTPPVEYATVRAGGRDYAAGANKSAARQPLGSGDSEASSASSLESESISSGPSYSAPAAGLSVLPLAAGGAAHEQADQLDRCSTKSEHNFQSLIATLTTRQDEQQARKLSLLRRFGSLVSKALTASAAGCSPVAAGGPDERPIDGRQPDGPERPAGERQQEQQQQPDRAPQQVASSLGSCQADLVILPPKQGLARRRDKTRRRPGARRPGASPASPARPSTSSSSVECLSLTAGSPDSRRPASPAGQRRRRLRAESLSDELESLVSRSESNRASGSTRRRRIELDCASPVVIAAAKMQSLRLDQERGRPAVDRQSSRATSTGSRSGLLRWFGSRESAPIGLRPADEQEDERSDSVWAFSSLIERRHASGRRDRPPAGPNQRRRRRHLTTNEQHQALIYTRLAVADKDDQDDDDQDELSSCCSSGCQSSDDSSASSHHADQRQSDNGRLDRRPSSQSLNVYQNILRNYAHHLRQHKSLAPGGQHHNRQRRQHNHQPADNDQRHHHHQRRHHHHHHHHHNHHQSHQSHHRHHHQHGRHNRHKRHKHSSRKHPEPPAAPAGRLRRQVASSASSSAANPQRSAKTAASVSGQLISISKQDGSQVVQLQRQPDSSWGFFVARGALNNVKGIFISRMHDSAASSSLAGLISIGDRILSIDDCSIGPDYDIVRLNQLISKKSRISMCLKPFKGT